MNMIPEYLHTGECLASKTTPPGGPFCRCGVRPGTKPTTPEQPESQPSAEALTAVDAILGSLQMRGANAWQRSRLAKPIDALLAPLRDRAASLEAEREMMYCTAMERLKEKDEQLRKAEAKAEKAQAELTALKKHLLARHHCDNFASKRAKPTKKPRRVWIYQYAGGALSQGYEPRNTAPGWGLRSQWVEFREVLKPKRKARR